MTSTPGYAGDAASPLATLAGNTIAHAIAVPLAAASHLIRVSM